MSSHAHPNPQQTPYWHNPRYPKLKGDVGDAAENGQLVLYPQVVRQNTDPPIQGQRFAILSFMQFDEVKVVNGVKVAGCVKVRGSWSDKSQAEYEASKLVKEVDSKFRMVIAPVGAWVPETDDPLFITGGVTDVEDPEQKVSLRGSVEKEKEAERRRIMKELRDNEDLAKSKDIYDDQESLDFYAMKRVTCFKLFEERERLETMVKDVKEKLDRTIDILRDLEVKYPEYKNEWIERYDRERIRAGIQPYKHSDEHEREYVEKIGLDKIESISSD